MSKASLQRFAGLRRVLLPLAAAFGLAGACANHYPVAPLRDGDAVCDQLVQYCAAPAAVWGSTYQACYDTGMRDNANACLDAENDCVESCYDANQSLPPAGEAGAAGAAAGASDAGGAGNEGGAPSSAGGDTQASLGAVSAPRSA